jgi:DNA mismatch endonuclease (patch repair protein)
VSDTPYPRDRSGILDAKYHAPVDTLTPEQRSDRMARVRSKNTRPEMVVRRLVHSMGFRYRLHSASLPGHPDMVFPRRHKVIFVHGCFWHRHEGCGRTPKSRLEFWLPKLEANRTRDMANQERLRDAGWAFLVLWECELHDREALALRIQAFLGGCAAGLAPERNVTYSQSTTGSTRMCADDSASYAGVTAAPL